MTGKAPTLIDLFAGVGGLSMGLEWAGFDLIYANEISEQHANALAVNHPKSEIEVGDIQNLDPRKIRKALGLGKRELTILCGGPPCQGFSVNAPIRSESDKRNLLFLDFLRFAKEFQPKVILIENVPGMLSFNRGKTVIDILDSLKMLGYCADVRILLAAHYGVPQMRWRTVFFATRKGSNIDPALMFPLPITRASARANFRQKFKGHPLVLEPSDVDQFTDSPHTTVFDAISDLPVIRNGSGQPDRGYSKKPRSTFQKELRKGSRRLTSHVCAGLGEVNLERVKHIPPGGSWRDIPFDLLPKGMKRARRSDHTKRYGRLHPKGLASTILTKCDPHWGSYIHYSQDRVLSVREAARIQGFPDRAKFVGSLSEQYEQVGNAVPPLLAKRLGERVMEVLEHKDLSINPAIKYLSHSEG